MAAESPKQLQSRPCESFRLYWHWLIVLGYFNKAAASLIAPGENNFTLTVSGYQFGFEDWQAGSSIAPLGGGRTWTYLQLGPLGYSEVPFTATQGLIGFVVILAVLITLPIALLATWRKKRAAP